MTQSQQKRNTACRYTMSFFSNHLLQATNELMKKYWDPKVRVKSKISPMDRQKSHPEEVEAAHSCAGCYLGQQQKSYLG